MTKATTSSVALAISAGRPSTYIIAGTPMKPPTAMVAASRPVAKPSGAITRNETLASMLLKWIIVPGMCRPRTQRTSGVSCLGPSPAVASPRFSRMPSRSTMVPTMPSTTTNTNDTYRFVPVVPKASRMATMMFLPNSTPASAKMPITMPSLMSTWP